MDDFITSITCEEYYMDDCPSDCEGGLCCDFCENYSCEDNPNN